MSDIFSPLPIVKHLKEFLPQLTDLFCDKISVAAEIITGTPQILRITEVAHGSSVGDKIVITDSLINNKITSVSQFTDADGTEILRFTTRSEHDLTFEYEDNLTDGKIQISGFTDTGLNTSFALYGVPSRNTFEIIYDTLPTLNGSEVLTEIWEIGLNEQLEISNIISVDVYEIELTDKPIYDLLPLPVINVVKQFRISSAVTFKRAAELYTSQNDNKLWAYLIMEDCNISKDRSIESDANKTDSPQNQQRSRLINYFSIVCFFPTANDLGGMDPVQLAWTDIFVFILSALQGKEFETFDNSNFVTAFTSHGTNDYVRAYYTHGYTFEYVFDITDIQAFTENFIKSRANRDIDFSFSEIEDGSNIDFDES